MCCDAGRAQPPTPRDRADGGDRSARLPAPARGAASAASAGWADLTFDGNANGWTGILRQRADGFPAASITSDSAGGSAVGRQSGTSTFLPASAGVGRVYGQSRGRPYLNLRPYTANGAGVPGASTTTYAFEAPTPASGWTVVLGDVDADQVTVSATGPEGTPVANADLGFRSAFNYCGAGSCAANDDEPIWDAATATLTGNARALDTNGASAWFEPRVPLSTLTFVFTRRGGFPVYQTWFASLSHTLSGTVDAPGDTPAGLTVRLFAPDGRQVGETTTDDGGRYTFGDLATYDGYRVSLVRPSGFTSNRPLTRTVDLGQDDRTVDFALRAVVPSGVSGTVTDPDGRPLPGVEVRLSGPGPYRVAVTDADGGYLFDQVPVGAGYTLTATPPDGTTASAQRTFSVPPDSDAPIEDQDFTITPDPRGSARGTVTAVGEGPVSGVRVVVTDDDGTERIASTDSEGRWSLDDLPPGRYTATVEPEPGEEVSGESTRSFTVPERDGTVDGLDFVLRIPAPPATYSAGGLVTDEAGLAFPNVTVTVRDPDGEPFATATTGEDGRWQVDGLLPAAGWTATVDPPGGNEAAGDATLTFTVADAGADSLDFVLVETSTGGWGSGPGSGSSSSGSHLAATGGPGLGLLLGGLAATAGGVALLGPRARSRRP